MSVGVLRQMVAGGYETVVHGHDAATGLRAIIVVHDTTLGPALGGVRVRDYAGEDEALTDALRLAEAMTYKAALAGLDLGGGKAVVVGVPPAELRTSAFLALGRMIDRLGGAYIATEDMGTTTADLEAVRRETARAVGLPPPGGGGDPSPTTAWGVMSGMQAALEALGEGDSLAGRTVAVQGVGKVGEALVGLLVAAGAVVTVADTDTARLAAVARTHGARSVAPDGIVSAPVDILAPCAGGAILDAASIAQLRCRIVAGGANNQLADDAAAEGLARRGILYVPDFVVNAGGLIHVADERNPGGFDAGRARAKAAGIRATTARVLAEARVSGMLPHRVAMRLARDRIAAARRGSS